MKNLFLLIMFAVSVNFYGQKLNRDSLNEIIKKYTKAIKKNPKSDSAYYNRACTKEKLKDYNLASEDYSKVIELNPKFIAAYINRGRIKHNKFKDDKGAIEDYNKVIEIDPKFANAYYYRGNAKKNLKDMKGACLDWVKAVELGNLDAKVRIIKYCK